MTFSTFPNFSQKFQRQHLRQQIKQRRQSLSFIEQQKASQQLLPKAIQLLTKRNAKTIAIYYAHAGEMPTLPIIHYCWTAGIAVYLPVILPATQQMQFAPFTKTTPMQANRYGILEPMAQAMDLAAEAFDIIFTPLVAFDEHNGRLGMGGGYYDRLLANWQERSIFPVGLAYRWQQIANLPLEKWDEPLAMILTD